MEAIHRRMAEQRLALMREIGSQREQASLAASSFAQMLRSTRSAADETLANREKHSNLKDHLKEFEADSRETLSVKTCKEATCTTAAESLSATITRINQLKKIVEDQRARKNEYAAVMSQQLLALESLEEKSNQYISEREKIQKAITWYSMVLGFRIEGGKGVKFIFDKIDHKNPDVEYSFTIRLDGDVYTLLHCDLHVEGVHELFKDLNETNDLFKFVRIMRGKFKNAALNGVLPAVTSIYPDSSSVTVSSPPPTSLSSCNETLAKESSSHIRPNLGSGSSSQEGIRTRIRRPSPQSSSPLRRSSRLMGTKFA